MARKDLRLMVEEAARGGQTLAMVPALAKLLDEGIPRFLAASLNLSLARPGQSRSVTNSSLQVVTIAYR